MIHIHFILLSGPIVQENMFDQIPANPKEPQAHKRHKASLGLLLPTNGSLQNLLILVPKFLFQSPPLPALDALKYLLINLLVLKSVIIEFVLLLLPEGLFEAEW